MFKREQEETTAQNANDDGIYTGFLQNGDFYIGTEPPAGGFATDSGEAGNEKKLALRNGWPECCSLCRRWIIDINNHQKRPENDYDYTIYCLSEYVSATNCNACCSPAIIDGIEVGFHTDYPDGCKHFEEVAGGSAAGGGSAEDGSAAGGSAAGGSAAGGGSAEDGSAAGGYIPPLRRQMPSVLIDGNRMYVFICDLCDELVYDSYGDSDRGYYCSKHSRHDRLGLSSPR